MVNQNPLENPTNLGTVTTVRRLIEPIQTTSCFVAQNTNQPSQSQIQSQSLSLSQSQLNNAVSQQTTSYTTQSLTTPIKGIIPKLQREESEGIPIPGRAQSHDDIRMLGTGSGYNTPNSNYGVSPNSPRGQYMYGCSPSGMPSNLSPPVNYNGGNSYLPKGGGFTAARRALSRATSPLSTSVPSNSYINNAQYKPSSSTNVRNNAVSNNCSRSDQMCPFHTKKKNQKHTQSSEQTYTAIYLLFVNVLSRFNSASGYFHQFHFLTVTRHIGHLYIKVVQTVWICICRKVKNCFCGMFRLWDIYIVLLIWNVMVCIHILFLYLIRLIVSAMTYVLLSFI